MIGGEVLKSIGMHEQVDGSHFIIIPQLRGVQSGVGRGQALISQLQVYSLQV